MNNRQILNERWSKIDNYLLSYLSNYNKINRNTKDSIQDVLNSIKINYKDINKIIPIVEKDRLNRKIRKVLKNKGYLSFKLIETLNKNNITYLELIRSLIYICYLEEEKELDEINEKLFYKVCENSYNQGIKDIGNKTMSFNLEIFYLLFNIPMFNATINEYLEMITLTNADEILNNTLVYMQLNKELDVNDKNYQGLFKKQKNRYISDNLNSGGIVDIAENLTNKAYLQAGIDTNTDKCRFVSEVDNRTTEMCNTLNNQQFYLNKMNIYQRYSDIDKRIITYQTQGLVQGENLPPINNHFHWCRSTITYLVDNERLNYGNITNEWLRVKENKTPKIKIFNKGETFNFRGRKYVFDNHNLKYEHTTREKDFAEWLIKNSNLDVTLLPKINKPDGISVPDYKIAKEYFDYKYTTGVSSQLIYHNIEKQNLQSRNFIIEIKNSNIDWLEIERQIKYTYRRLDWVEKIGIKKDNQFKMYNKKSNDTR